MAKSTRTSKQAEGRETSADLLDVVAQQERTEPSSTLKQLGDPNTRQRLLEAATKVFGERTFLNATVDDIVREAQCARGTFYLYFKDRRDAFEHVVGQLVEQIIREVQIHEDTGGDIFARIKSSNRAFLKFLPKHAGIFRDMYVVASFDPAVEEFVVELEKPFAARYRRRLQKSMVDVEQDHINVEVASWIFTVMIEYFAYVWLAAKQLPGGDTFDMEDVVSTISSLMYRAIFLKASHVRVDPERVQPSSESL